MGPYAAFPPYISYFYDSWLDVVIYLESNILKDGRDLTWACDIST